ncbi:hypothetical protein D0Z00_001242 [Geotrichum galactomycetum]|uniref:Uncharacterized protein n=1 Tax=Geotrichum galactomycetum TaxID=27317 RepID=A0ACB6V7N0_9ASCO|nr:hypothetical protein D0Z00_001242 [Geotrichum candidum]
MKPTAEVPAPPQQEQQQQKQKQQKQYRRFSLNIFSKDRKSPKSTAPRPLSVPIAPKGLEPIPAKLEPSPTPAFIIDDSVLTGSFGDLNFDCNSFIPGSPPTRLLSGENSNTELRALAFLFNVWEHIPIRASSSSSGSASPFDLAGDQRNIGRPEDEDDIFDLYFDEQEGLRWSFSVWLVSPELWQRYFCHWHPLVRAYYLRLLCWRVASVGASSGLLSSVIFSNYNTDVRFLLEKRLQYTFSRYQEMCNGNSRIGKVSSLACDPVLNKRLAIVYNPACNHEIMRKGESFEAAKQRRIDPYEVFDDIAYSCPAIDKNNANLHILSAKHEDDKTICTQSFSSNLRKRWTELTGSSSDNLKKYFSISNNDEFYHSNKSEEYPPSLTFSSSTMSTGSYAPSQSSTHSTDDSEDEPPSSLTMSLIPPPPRLLRQRPEIMRTMFKFSLEYNDQSIQRYYDKMHGWSGSPDYASAQVRLPRLPFDSNHVAATTAAAPNREELVAIVNSEFEIGNRNTSDEQYFKYGGRALNEWTRIVAEFEDFVRDRRIKEGAIRLDDIEMPFMVAEIKVLQ